MVPCCRGAEHATSRRGRTRIIAIPTVEVEVVVVAMSVVPRRRVRARKHGRRRKYQESKFPCHDRGSSALTSEDTIDQSAACSKRRIRRMQGCAIRIGGSGDLLRTFAMPHDSADSISRQTPIVIGFPPLYELLLHQGSREWRSRPRWLTRVALCPGKLLRSLFLACTTYSSYRLRDPNAGEKIQVTSGS
jgi:hypothetical protein